MYNEMSNEELEEIKENLEVQVKDLLNAKERLFKALNDIPEIDECDYLNKCIEESIREVDALLKSISNDIEDIIDILEEDRSSEYTERQREYRDMQGF